MKITRLVCQIRVIKHQSKFVNVFPMCNIIQRVRVRVSRTKGGPFFSVKSWSACISMSKALLAPFTQEMYNKIKSGIRGPPANSDEGKAICNTAGFGYCQLFGALI